MATTANLRKRSVIEPMSDWGSDDETPVVRAAAFKDDSGSEDEWEKEAELLEAKAKAEAAKAAFAEKAEHERQMREAEIALAGDLFGDNAPRFDADVLKPKAKLVKEASVANTADFWETFSIVRQTDLDSFVAKLNPKIKESKVNSAGFYKFALSLLPEICEKMEQKDIGNLQKKLEEEFKKKNVKKGAQRDMKKKPNDRVNAVEELDIRYGDVEDDYYDEDEDDYAQEY